MAVERGFVLPAHYRVLLMGRGSHATRRGFALAILVALLTASGLMGVLSVAGTLSSGTPFVAALALTSLALSAAFAYFRDGLVPCLFLATAPLFGWVFVDFAAVDSYPPAPTGLELLLTTAATSAIAGVPLGLCGFVLGAGLRRVWTRHGRSRVVEGGS